MPTPDLRRKIQDVLKSFRELSVKDSSIELFKLLGYESEKTLTFRTNDAAGFKRFLKDNSSASPNETKARTEEWKSIDFLFQLTDSEIKRNKGLFDNAGVDVSDTRIESYLFFAIELTGAEYSRTKLAEITREINKVFPMPAMIIFRYGDGITFSIIDRRVHKREESKDVLGKVTLIKDIRLDNTHRAHIDILADLALKNLKDPKNWVELHKEWQRVLDTKELNKKFFRELANWYFWAVKTVKFPNGDDLPDEEHRATSVIRLITRLIFVWFIKEKGLVPPQLFDEEYLHSILNFRDESAYYKAVLQNMFFATLNSEMGTRKFIADGSGGRNNQHFVHNVFRYKDEFKDPAKAVKELFEPIPFLNGGLFECLDKEVEDAETAEKKTVRIDGFSQHRKNPLYVPDELFFSDEKEIDLNEAYGTRNKRYKVRGLINILNSYKFTVAENTPVEEEIALDPELLGRVFENLLANYNPETKTTARKQTGSFYTPREIVNYMVDESLIAYLKQKLQTETEGFGFIAIDEYQTTMFGNEARIQQKFEMPLSQNRFAAAGTLRKPAREQGLNIHDEVEDILRQLFSYTDDKNPFNETETEILIKAIDNCKILDPACGSGAFPMGVLHRLVHLLGKLDPNNEKWREWQRQKAIRETEEAYKIGDNKEREARLLEINDVFENNASDYGRKLFLIENCIYGVDIQPIAIQIAKLRFFVSLVVEEEVRGGPENNLGIRPLPNLETKFVAANALLGFEEGRLRSERAQKLELELATVRAQHFAARTRRAKERYRAKDKELRSNLAEVLVAEGVPTGSASHVAGWDPYKQNEVCPWFSSEWMFNVTGGFDIVIANPPYLSALDFAKCYPNHDRSQLSVRYQSTRGAYDLFVPFYERGIELLTNRGILTFISPNKVLSASYAASLRTYLAANTSVRFLVDVSGINVFREAAVYPIIFSLQKNGPSSAPMILTLPPTRELEEFDPDVFVDREAPQTLLTLLPDNIWGFLLSNHVALLTKMITGTRPLATVGQINATSTASEADVFTDYISDSAQNDSLKVVNTGTIDPYVSLWGQQPMSHSGERYATPWFDIRSAPINARRREMYESPKIIFAKMSRTCEAFLDDSGSYASVNTNCFYKPIASVDIRYVLAYANSKVFMFFYKQFFGSLRMSGGYFQFQSPQLRVIPFRNTSEEDQKAVTTVVDRILKMKLRNPNADVSADENALNRHFFKLYGLTEDDIASLAESLED